MTLFVYCVYHLFYISLGHDIYRSTNELALRSVYFS